MVALAAPVHEQVEVGTPFYAGGPRPGLAGAGKPVFHKYDNADFVNGFLKEIARAAQTNAAPPSMLPIDVATQNRALPDFDVDAYDYVGNRYRKIYLPSHFRFYLASCELRCLVPGFPAPSMIKQVEFVIRRVAIGRHASPSAPPFAWVPVPDPSQFPRLPGADTPPMALAPRLTGNTHTWWPMVSPDLAFPDEKRFRMTRVPAVALPGRAVFFGFLPVASGEMWGPKSVPEDTSDAGKPPVLTPTTTTPPTQNPRPSSWPPATDLDQPKIPPWNAGDVAATLHQLGLDGSVTPPADPPAALDPGSVVLDNPLVKAPSKFALAPPIMRNWLRSVTTVLQLILGNKSTGPRPKFESPRLHDDHATDGFAYVVQCVATLEPKPGCLVERWGAPSLPFLIAPHFDPFAGRPTQIEVPTLRALKKMLGNITSAAQFAKRAPGVGLKYNDCPLQPAPGTSPSSGMSIMGIPIPPIPGTDFPKMPNITMPGQSPACGPAGPEICFNGIPLFTITAYIMFIIAIVILTMIAMPLLSILLLMKFCIPIGPSE